MIQRALNNWIALGPSKTPKMTGKDYAQLRRLKAMATKSAIRQESAPMPILPTEIEGHINEEIAPGAFG
jgi:hypothetical protein